MQTEGEIGWSVDFVETSSRLQESTAGKTALNGEEGAGVEGTRDAYTRHYYWLLHCNSETPLQTVLEKL